MALRIYNNNIPSANLHFLHIRLRNLYIKFKVYFRRFKDQEKFLENKIYEILGIRSWILRNV